MSLRILIIDDHAEFRALLKHHLTLRWPAAELHEHDPVVNGPLPTGFSGEGLDLVLLDYQLGGDQTGLDYLKRFRGIAGFPPVIMLTATGNEDLAVAAIKGGATDYIPKQNMTHERLTSSVQGALDSRDPAVRAAAEPPRTLDQPPAGLVIGGYRLLRRLAEGGAGTVYLGQKGEDGPHVAIKLMARRLPSGEESKEALRLSREYAAVRRVESPRIVQLHELGVADGHVYVVMEYFPHGSLREHLDGPVSREVALDYAQQIASALEIIHRAGILHRDLKPANIMLRSDGSLALIDFGSAKFAGEEGTITEAGKVLGTPQYMSPEQCAGIALTPASDLYAVGIVLFEMLTGQPPYNAATPLAVLYKHQYAPLPQLPPAHAELQPVLDTLLAKNPLERYPRARELLQDLARL